MIILFTIGFNIKDGTLYEYLTSNGDYNIIGLLLMMFNYLVFLFMLNTLLLQHTSLSLLVIGCILY